MKTGVHIFIKIKNTDGWKKIKKLFSVISFQKFLIFPIWNFKKNAQCFVRALLKLENLHFCEKITRKIIICTKYRTVLRARRQIFYEFLIFCKLILRAFNPLRVNHTKCSNTLKQFIGQQPINCFSVFDHFVGLALKGLSEWNKTDKSKLWEGSKIFAIHFDV